MSADEGNKPCVQTNTPKDCQQDLLLKILTKYLGTRLLLHNWVFDSRVKTFGKPYWHIILGCGGGGRGVRQAGGGGAVQRGDAAAAPPPAPAPARLLDPEGEGEERLGPRRQELQTTLQEQEIQVSLCSVSKDTAD